MLNWNMSAYLEPSYFVHNISTLRSAFRTSPEGNEIKDFNVGLRLIKNQIKKFFIKK